MSEVSLKGYGPSKGRLYFDGDERRFELWEVKFLGHMRIKKLNDVFSTSIADTAVDVNKNAEAYATLVLCLDDRSLSLIMRDCVDDGRKALRVLREHYRPKGKPRIISLYTELTLLKKSDGEPITDYVLRAEYASSALDNAGEKVSDRLLIAMFMKGLPEGFKPFAAVIMQKDKELNFQEFKVALRNFDETEQARGGASSVMFVTRKGKDDVKKYGEKFIRKCFSCGKSGHRANDCCVRDNNKRWWCSICKSATHDTKY